MPLKMNPLGCDTVTSLAIRPLFPFLKMRRPPRILSLLFSKSWVKCYCWGVQMKRLEDGKMFMVHIT